MVLTMGFKTKGPTKAQYDSYCEWEVFDGLSLYSFYVRGWHLQKQNVS